VGVKGLIRQAKTGLQALDREVPLNYLEQKEFLQAAVIAWMRW